MTEPINREWSELIIDFPVGREMMIAVYPPGLVTVQGGKIEEASPNLLVVSFSEGGIIINPSAYTRIIKVRENGYFLSGSTPAMGKATPVFLSYFLDDIPPGRDEILRSIANMTKWKM